MQLSSLTQANLRGAVCSWVHGSNVTIYYRGDPLPLVTDGQRIASLDDRLREVRTNSTAPNEIIPHGVPDNYGWKYQQQTAMGCVPLRSGVPAWWDGTSPDEWRAMLPWFIAYEDATRNVSQHAKIEVSGIELWVMSMAGKWQLVSSGLSPYWSDPFSENAVDRLPANATSIERTGSSHIFRPGNGVAVHGGLSKANTPWGASAPDIKAICASVRHRLVPGDIDDTEDAFLGVQCGVDYWPSVNSTIADVAPAKYLPSACAGRFMRSAADWKRSTVYCRRADTTDYQVFSAAPPDFIYWT